MIKWLYYCFSTIHCCLWTARRLDWNAFEGIVAKGGEKHNLWMVKCKSMLYLDKLKEKNNERTS